MAQRVMISWVINTASLVLEGNSRQKSTQPQHLLHGLQYQSMAHIPLVERLCDRFLSGSGCQILADALE